MSNYCKDGCESTDKPFVLCGFAAIPLWSGGAILVYQDGKLQKLAILQGKTEEKKQNR